jgi:hypothetical protein
MKHCCHLCESTDTTAERIIEVMRAKTIFAQPVLRLLDSASIELRQLKNLQ